MVKKECCCSTSKTWGLLVLIVGILYLGQDLGWWSFWALNWWTVAFLIIGIHKFQKAIK
ncbi:hypothetical protein ISS04_02900 [Candidatus Woesearchaeota archaeon]|nr:hypothetical protein [Candidatus Woesearchaeota archaeon]